MKACWAHDPPSRPPFPLIIDSLCKFTFPLNVKTHRRLVFPDSAASRGAPDLDVVDFAHLYLVLDSRTYARVFAGLLRGDRSAVMATCKYWREVVEEMKRK
jgi:hypothetical protein